MRAVSSPWGARGGIRHGGGTRPAGGQVQGLFRLYLGRYNAAQQDGTLCNFSSDNDATMGLKPILVSYTSKKG